ncbi:MAG: YebG family protein, partial [Desulfobacterium sp.]
MAVIVKYVVVRDGNEKMTFTTKKEADAHDKMLDIAENLYHFLRTENMELSEEQMDELSLCLAKNKHVLLQLLKGGNVPQPSKTTAVKKTEPPAPLQKTVKKEADNTDAASKTDEGSGEKKKKTGKQK